MEGSEQGIILTALLRECPAQVQRRPGVQGAETGVGKVRPGQKEEVSMEASTMIGPRAVGAWSGVVMEMTRSSKIQGIC